MKHTLLLVLTLVSLCAYSQQDSLKVVRLLERGRAEATAPTHLWYAQQLIGTPYVGQTLEINDTEQLVVNLNALDCTTFVETAIALAMTQKQGSTKYEDYCHNLTKIRYRDGISKYLLGIKKYNSMGFSNDDIKILNLIDNLLASDITINESKFIIEIIILLRADGYTSYIKEDALYIKLKQ